MALAGSEERAGWEGSASVTSMHAPFPTEVECKYRSIDLRISSRMTLPDPTRCSGCDPPLASKDRLLQSWPDCKCPHAVGAPTVSAVRIAPTSGRIVA
jgi:hypothetical protein